MRDKVGTTVGNLCVEPSAATAARAHLPIAMKLPFSGIAAGFFTLALFGAFSRLGAAPRLLEYGYPNCASSRVPIRGRRLLNSSGRGIDVAQSLSQSDHSCRPGRLRVRVEF